MRSRALRAYRLHVPARLDAGKPAPLFIYLHGLGASGEVLMRTLDLSAFADEKGILVAAPDGTRDSTGTRFWNATAACCDFERTGTDDIAYLDALIDDVHTRHPVDPRRIFVIGYSNGAFMAQRAACELSHRIAAVASFSGAGWKQPERCAPTAPITVLHVHGDADRSVAYDGGRLPQRSDLPRYPGARETVAAWAERNGCAREPPLAGRGPPVSGKRTTRFRFARCPRAAVELWTVHEGGHLIGMEHADVEATYQFLMSHPKLEGGRRDLHARTP